MKKRWTILFLLLQINSGLFSQVSEETMSHSGFISFDNWTYRDTHTFYGYQMNLKKHVFEIGISLERKRLPWFYQHPSGMYYSILGGYGYDVQYFKDTSFSFIPTGIMVGYSYIFKPESRLTAYPFIRNYTVCYFRNDVFMETDSNGVQSEFRYRVNHWQFSTQLGCGFRFRLNDRIQIKQEFGLGVYFRRDFYESDYFEAIKDLEWTGFTGYMRLSVAYKFK